MKNLLTLIAFLLFAGVAVAKEKEKSNADVKVTVKENTVKVFYLAEAKHQVKVQILDENQQIVFSERIKSDKFMRPYNISKLKDGKYFVKVIDDSGVEVVDEIVKSQSVLPTDLQYVLLKQLEGPKFALIAGSGMSDTFHMVVKDEDNQVVYEAYKDVNNPAGSVYNIKDSKSENFKVEVTNDNGEAVKVVIL